MRRHHFLPHSTPLAGAGLVALGVITAADVPAGTAHAADIQVSYRVDAKELKKNTPAGTSLAFQVFTDSTCTTSSSVVQNVNVEAVMLIEQPKLIKVKNGPKPPSVAQIRYTMTGLTPQPAFYATVTGTGILPVGGACQLQTASVGGTLPPPPLSCPPDEVLSGSICVDKYEASLWDIPPAQMAVIQKVKDGTVTLADLTGAGATQVGCTFAPFSLTAIPGTFPVVGNYTAPIYAASVSGVPPSTCVSAYQAKAACEFSTRRLLLNSEWTQAANGTPPTYTDNGTTDCNTANLAPGPVYTGARSGCVSASGAADMLVTSGSGRLIPVAGSAAEPGTPACSAESWARTGATRTAKPVTSGFVVRGSWACPAPPHPFRGLWLLNNLRLVIQSASALLPARGPEHCCSESFP